MEPYTHYVPEGPALLSAPDDSICWVKQAAPLLAPCFFLGQLPWSPPHCWAHRTQTLGLI